MTRTEQSFVWPIVPPLVRALLSTLTLLLTLALTLPALAQGPVRGGTLPGPLPLFPATNWWNQDISSAPLDPASDSFIAWIQNGGIRRVHPDFGGDSGASAPDPLIYGMVYVTVPGDQPLEPVTFFYDDESDPGAPGRPAGYPIPVEARTQDRWIEGGIPGGGPDGDRHMLLVDRDNRLLYELWATQWNATAGRWEAGSGAVFSLDSNARRPEGWTSADAAGLAVLPGLVRYDEVYGTEPIRHAFRVTVRATNGHVWPASHTAGSRDGAPPMGTRLRLKASKDISSYPPEIRKIFQAMKTYGVIVADNGSDMYVSGAYDPRWNNDILNPAFHSLNAGDFEVIQLGWKPPVSVSSYAGSQKLRIRAGDYWQTLQYNYSTQAMSIGPVYFGDNTSAISGLVAEQWRGSFLYDYLHGSFTRAVYLFEDAL